MVVSVFFVLLFVFFFTEDGVVSWFERLEMQHYLKPLVQRVSTAIASYTIPS